MSSALRIFFIVLSFIVLTGALPAQDSCVKYVNPFIGTSGMGHVFPGACSPFGSIQLSPDTDTIPHNVNGVYQKEVYRYCAGYQYKDQTIVGFSHTHLSGTGHSDLGDILIMPTNGNRYLNPGTSDNPDKGYRSRFSHETEKASPGYYEVVLSDYNIKAQLTATERTGVHKYTFPASNEQRIIVDLQHGIYNYDGKTLWAYLRVENDSLLTGYRITNGWARTNYTYFAISFSRPILQYGYTDRQKIAYNGFWRKLQISKNFPEIAGRKVVAYFEFDPEANNELEIKVALSAVSTRGALKNLDAEAKNLSFDEIVQQTQRKWDTELSRFEVKGSNDQQVMFYTSLYHTMINPSVYMDVDRLYRGVDHNIHLASDFTNYTIFSLWDTYRALHPLFTIFHPERNGDMIKSMIKHSEQSVHNALPIWSHMGNENWCMIGYHGVSILSDAHTKGLDLDIHKSLKSMVSSSNIPYYDHTAEYVRLGYIPFDKNASSASVSLEYCYDDWCIYQLALRSKDPKLTDHYYERANNYKNSFDPSGFARGRLSDGSWKKDFNALNTHGEGFIEGNSWNYSFYVPHDIKGLIEIMGGNDSFIDRMDSLFVMGLPSEYYAETEDITKEGLLGNYVHGNEPGHQIPYLYAWSSQPWKTQYWVREIMNKMYRNHNEGLCGNDDCGQMSAWYIFSAMGFYPVCPGSNQYVLGAPYMSYLKMKLGNGRYLEIISPKVSDRNRYVKSVKINGKDHKKMYITHEELMNGGKIVFEMDDKPNKKRGILEDSKPYSLTK